MRAGSSACKANRLPLRRSFPSASDGPQLARCGLKELRRYETVIVPLNHQAFGQDDWADGLIAYRSDGRGCLRRRRQTPGGCSGAREPVVGAYIAVSCAHCRGWATNRSVRSREAVASQFVELSALSLFRLSNQRWSRLPYPRHRAIERRNTSGIIRCPTTCDARLHLLRNTG
jgi:hypothetical protein